ncbi:MAG: hypothetical protein IT326_02310 [Anaerolineae bacterium]|nr:hypothetical protein [Anaerolineae bacterium]
MLIATTRLASAAPGTGEHDDLKRWIAHEDAAPDALVYRLYGLTDEEIAIVEGR